MAMSRIVKNNAIGTDCLCNQGYGDPAVLPLRKPYLEFDEAADII